MIQPARGRNQTGVHKVGGPRPIRGGLGRSGGDQHADGATWGQGADAATNPAARGDDSFSAEVSSGEAQGQDLGLSPSSDTQGLTPGDNQLNPSAGNQKGFPDEG